MNGRLFTTLAAGLLAAACQSPHQETTYVRPSPATTTAYAAPYPTSEQACTDYGFAAGTAGFNACVSRERAARAAGRVSPDYAEVNLTRDAQNACYSYGLQPRTAAYDRCVGREIDARRYRAEARVAGYPPYHTDQYGYRVDSQGYRVDANGYRLVTQPVYVAPAYTPVVSSADQRPATTGQAAFRDEFGFRYDSQGNRIDRNGNVISPQTTTP
jgi:hypothetical protein